MNYNSFLNKDYKYIDYAYEIKGKRRKRSYILLLSSFVFVGLLTTATMHWSDAALHTSIDTEIDIPSNLSLPEKDKSDSDPQLKTVELALPANNSITERPDEIRKTLELTINEVSDEQNEISSENIEINENIAFVETLNIPAQVEDNNVAKDQHNESGKNELLIEDSASEDGALANNIQDDRKNASESVVHKVTVKSGDSLSAIFKREGLSASLLHKILQSGKDAGQLAKIKPGQEFLFEFDNDNNLNRLVLKINEIDSLIIEQTDNGFNPYIQTKDVDVRSKFVSNTIDSSLFESANDAGLTDAMTMNLAYLFGWDIDFALDIRKGDSFSLIYEEKWVNDKLVEEGNIIAAEFTNQGKTYEIVRYTDSSGHTDYYTPDGYSIRKAFIRTPVDFTRISSRFSLSRNHPILKQSRAHKGVDYAAPTGTPIKSAGDGKIIFRGKKGGYGNVVIIQHGERYSTLYGHLSKFNSSAKNGSRVKQGQIIGYVGSSGLATGPHLHYEFRIDGVHRNPLTVSLPEALPLDKKYRADFGKYAQTQLSELKAYQKSAVALNSAE